MLFLIDKKGRRFLMLRTLPFMGLSMLGLSFAFYLMSYHSYNWAQWLALLSMAVYLAFFVFGMGATPYAVNGEIYPLPLRATANSLAIATHWISNYLVTAAFLSAIQSNIGSVMLPITLGTYLRLLWPVLFARNSVHLLVSA